MFAWAQNWGMVILMGWAVAGPLLTYGATELSAHFSKVSAVRDARFEEQEKAEKKRLEDIRAVNEEANKRVAAAMEAVTSLDPTPTTTEELRKLCDASASCRDRRKK